MKRNLYLKRKLTSVLLIIAITLTMSFTMTSKSFASDLTTPLVIQVQVDNSDSVNLKAYYSSYKWNDYVSLRDFASSLNNTSKQFNVVYDKNEDTTNIIIGEKYVPIGGEGEAVTREECWSSSTVASLSINGSPVKYAVYIINNEIYIKLADLLPALNINAEYNNTNEKIIVDTTKDFYVDINALDESGYFSSLHGSIVGNATTGDILYSSKSTNKVAIASTTKLMTYLLVKEAVAAKKISMDQVVTLSKNVETEASSEDGTIPMKEGQKVTIEELVQGMLTVSSNEAALALAEAVSGTEKSFVALMNNRATQLGLTSATFYNPHGLPNFSASVLQSKRQNTMSAGDLYKLSSYIINKYPELVELTSKKTVTLDALNYEGNNTNRLLWNMATVDGLKTGSTNRAGSCLVATSTVSVGGKTQRIVSVILGGEGTAETAEKSIILQKYASQVYNEYGSSIAALKSMTIKTSAKAYSNKITLSWKSSSIKVTSIKYEVYKSTKKNSGYSKIASVSKITCTNTANLKKNTTYYYKVRGYITVNGKNIYSNWSNKTTAKLS